MAEIYQTDLLHFQESESACSQCIEKALAVDAACLDAYLQLANFQLNKELFEAAKGTLQHIDDQLAALDEEAADLYTQSFKLQTAKMFFEVDDYKRPIRLLE